MINPILASSARRRMRSIRTPILITIYGAMIFASGLGIAFGAFTSSTLSIFAMREGVTAYAAMLVIQFAMILLIPPAMTAGSIAGERERQTLDMLLVTNTGSLRIVAGKLLESLGYVALLLVAALPTMCLTLITGGVTLADVLTGALFLLAGIILLFFAGKFLSAWKRTPLFSTLIAALVMIVIQTYSLGFAFDSYGAWGNFWLVNFLNVLRSNASVGMIALGMTFVIISGGIDLAVGSTMVAIGAVVVAVFK